MGQFILDYGSNRGDEKAEDVREASTSAQPETGRPADPPVESMSFGETSEEEPEDAVRPPLSAG